MSRELLQDLVNIYSPSTQEAPAVAYLVDWLNAHGFRAEIDEAGNAVGARGAENAPYTIMLLGHIDTVHGQIPVRVEDEVLYGRGSVDAKGSLCTFASAAAAAALPEMWRVVVVGAVEEETATSKGARYIRDAHNPTLCVIGEPSGAGRITLGYKGRLVAEYRLTRAIGHTARPEPSAGALGAQFWNRVVTWADQQNWNIEKYFDQVMCNLRSINTESDDFYDTVHMMIGFRLPPSHTPNDVTAAVSRLADPDSDLRFYGKEPAYRAEKNTSLVRGMLAAIRANGHKPGFVLKTGTSDMNIVGAKWNCPMVAYGPGDSNLDHTPHEHLPLAEYDLAIQILTHLLENL